MMLLHSLTSIAFLDLENHKVDTKYVFLAHRWRVMDIQMSNLLNIGHHLVFCSSNFKSDDVIEFCDPENHKVDSTIKSLSLIELAIRIRIPISH